MATAKALQVPKIIEIQAGRIRVAHPYIKGNISCSLAASIAAGGTAMSLYDNNGLADDDWLLVGRPGERETEITDVNGAVTRGQAVTVTNYLKFSHGLDTPVTKIFERGIKIYGAATDGGAGTLIASIDAITLSLPQLADTVMIQWDKDFTEFTLITTDTAYAYYFAKFTDGVTDSAASVYVPSTGLAHNKVESLIDQALTFSNSKIDGRRLTREMFIDWYNDCQNAVSQYTYQDPGSGRWLQKDWSFEVVADEGITLVEGEDAYALSGLTYTTKYPNSDKSIMSVQVGNERPLQKIAIKDFDLLRRGVNKTYTNGAAGIGDVVLTVDSTANFPSTGSVTVAGQTITYTATTATEFTGVPASGTGSITAIIADNTPVWQNISNGMPTKYTLFNGILYFDFPVSSDYAGKTIKVRHFKALDRITSVAEGTEIPFTNVITMYLTSSALYRQGQNGEGEKWMADFKKQMTSNAQADYIPILDEWHYYNFQDDIFDSTDTWDNTNWT
jgi:hypothetical protein